MTAATREPASPQWDDGRQRQRLIGTVECAGRALEVRAPRKPDQCDFDIWAVWAMRDDGFSKSVPVGLRRHQLAALIQVLQQALDGVPPRPVETQPSRPPRRRTADPVRPPGTPPAGWVRAQQAGQR